MSLSAFSAVAAACCLLLFRTCRTWLLFDPFQAGVLQLFSAPLFVWGWPTKMVDLDGKQSCSERLKPSTLPAMTKPGQKGDPEGASFPFAVRRAVANPTRRVPSIT